MNFDFSKEQNQLRDAARRFFENEVPTTYVRKMYEVGGLDRGLWRKMAELGWLGLTIPEAYGGLGATFLDFAVVAEEAGRAVCPAPLAEAVAVAEAIKAGGSEAAKQKWLAAIAEGQCVATIAMLDDVNSPWEPEAVTLRAEGARITGTKHCVPFGAQADLFLVVCQGPRLFLVDAKSPGVSVTPSPCMDLTYRQAEVHFVNVQGTPLAEDALALQRALNRAAVALSLEYVGLAEAVTSMTVTYSKQRIAFGVPIGSFQAVKHQAAEMFVHTENAKALSYWAAWAQDQDDRQANEAAAVAKAYTSEACRWTAGRGIQLHGGIAFTWEHDMHLFFKRAKRMEFAYGDTVYHRERVAQHVM